MLRLRFRFVALALPVLAGVAVHGVVFAGEPQDVTVYCCDADKPQCVKTTTEDAVEYVSGCKYGADAKKMCEDSCAEERIGLCCYNGRNIFPIWPSYFSKWNDPHYRRPRHYGTKWECEDAFALAQSVHEPGVSRTRIENFEYGKDATESAYYRLGNFLPLGTYDSNETRDQVCGEEYVYCCEGDNIGQIVPKGICGKSVPLEEGKDRTEYPDLCKNAKTETSEKIRSKNSGFCCNLQARTVQTGPEVTKSQCESGGSDMKFIAAPTREYKAADKDRDGSASQEEAMDLCFGQNGPLAQADNQLWCCTPPPGQGGAQINNREFQNSGVNVGTQRPTGGANGRTTTRPAGNPFNSLNVNPLPGSLLADILDESFGDDGTCAMVKEHADGRGPGCPRGAKSVVGSLFSCTDACDDFGDAGPGDRGPADGPDSGSDNETDNGFIGGNGSGVTGGNGGGQQGGRGENGGNGGANSSTMNGNSGGGTAGGTTGNSDGGRGENGGNGAGNTGGTNGGTTSGTVGGTGNTTSDPTTGTKSSDGDNDNDDDDSASSEKSVASFSERSSGASGNSSSTSSTSSSATSRGGEDTEDTGDSGGAGGAGGAGGTGAEPRSRTCTVGTVCVEDAMAQCLTRGGTCVKSCTKDSDGFLAASNSSKISGGCCCKLPKISSASSQSLSSASASSTSSSSSVGGVGAQLIDGVGGGNVAGIGAVLGMGAVGIVGMRWGRRPPARSSSKKTKKKRK